MMELAAIVLASAMQLKAADSKDVKCIADVVYFEARGEPTKGKIAVANVIKNRLNDPKYPKSYCKVTHQKGQFSFHWDRKPNIINDKRAYETARQIAIALVLNKLRDITNGAVSFKKVGIRSSSFYKLKHNVRIGKHDFYGYTT